MQSITIPCGCKLSVGVVSPDGNYIKDRAGDTLTGNMTICHTHALAPRMADAVVVALDAYAKGTFDPVAFKLLLRLVEDIKKGQKK